MLTLGKKALSVPILQGGMGVGVSLGGLAGAVAACGGMGCISTADAGYREPDFARDPAAANHRALAAEIRKAKEIAHGAGMVAINAMVATQDYAAAIRTAVEAGVDAVVSGAGLPLELPGLVNTPDVAIAPIVSSGRAAKLILRRWAKAFGRTADFVVIEGCKAGGHLGFAEEELLAGTCQPLDTILPEVLAEVKPFAGGLAETELDCQRMESERARNTSFEPSTEGYQTVEFDLALTDTVLTRWVDPTPFIPHNEQLRAERCELILKMQADGLAKRLEHARAKTAVIGISGGLDSCLALLVAVRAMKQLGRPTTDVLAVTMPCFGTTKRTRSNAEILCDELHVSFTEIHIANTVHSHFADIGQDESVLDVTFENGQARVRTLELMDTANRTGGLVVGTGDLSELALGWATYNGDHMSMYGVNAGVPKTLVRHLVRYEADIAATAELKNVLLDILDTPVSPELLPAKDGEIAQKTEDLVGPYELHDFYLYYVLRFGFGPAKIFRLAKAAFAGRAEYPDEVLYKWLRNFYWRFFAQQFKRSCLPDGPKIGSVTLSPRGDWRMPSDACAALWLAELEQLFPQKDA